jgi:hypothetical protein
MSIRRLPTPVPAAVGGWCFTGPWTAEERVSIERILRERIPNAGQAQADSWSFLRWEGAQSDARYYAHCPGVHPAGFGYTSATAEDLADELWDYYFTLHVGPLCWSTADLPTPAAAPIPARVDERDDIIEQILGSQHHATHGLALLAAGDAAAARRELALALAL